MTRRLGNTSVLTKENSLDIVSKKGSESTMLFLKGRMTGKKIKLSGLIHVTNYCFIAMFYFQDTTYS